MLMTSSLLIQVQVMVDHWGKTNQNDSIKMYIINKISTCLHIDLKMYHKRCNKRLERLLGSLLIGEGDGQ